MRTQKKAVLVLPRTALVEGRAVAKSAIESVIWAVTQTVSKLKKRHPSVCLSVCLMPGLSSLLLEERPGWRRHRTGRDEIVNQNRNNKEIKRENNNDN